MRIIKTYVVTLEQGANVEEVRKELNKFCIIYHEMPNSNIIIVATDRSEDAMKVEGVKSVEADDEEFI